MEGNHLAWLNVLFELGCDCLTPNNFSTYATFFFSQAGIRMCKQIDRQI